ncbi:MAG: 50S ribosomal protein L10 [Thermoprotei archaeon]|nr:MAG: 50S ribosomal protein L10 [Thermoprotei archaeon]
MALQVFRRVPRAERIPEWKIKEVEELTNLFKQYKVFAIADLQGLPTAQLQQIRKRLRGKVYFRVSKNTLVKKALEKIGIKDEKIFNVLQGQNLFIFTNLNAFELYNLLEKHKTYTFYKPGDIADKEIVIPAGNTGLSPGPILSTFSKLKIPIRVQGNSVWVAKDTVVAKPGDKISGDLASLLQRLGIAPKEIKIKLKVAYDNGILIPAGQLKLDLEKYKSDIITAYTNALKIGVEIAWPVPQILELSLKKAFIRALALATEIGFVTPETAQYVFAKAIAKAMALAAAVSEKAPELGLKVAAPKPEKPAEEKKEEKEEKKEEEKAEEEKESVSEEELEAGLGALFG